MQNSYIHIRTQEETKNEAQKIALEFGFSLSDLINAYLKQVARDKKVTFSFQSQQADQTSKNSPNKQLTVKEIKDKAFPILKQAQVKRAALFGSYARGDETETSDIDILVDLADKSTLIDLIGLQQDLEETLQKKVDVVEYAGIKPRIKESIMQQQISIL